MNDKPESLPLSGEEASHDAEPSEPTTPEQTPSSPTAPEEPAASDADNEPGDVVSDDSDTEAASEETEPVNDVADEPPAEAAAEPEPTPEATTPPNDPAEEPQPEETPARPFLVCIDGPDEGRRFEVTSLSTTLGRGPTAAISSKDPAVADQHIIFQLVDGKPAYQALGHAKVFVNGRQLTRCTIEPGEKLTIGDSVWTVETGRHGGIAGVFSRMGSRIVKSSGAAKPSSLPNGSIFSEVFRMRSDAEIEAYLGVGTAHTTPTLSEVETDWPKPWACIWATAIAGFLHLLLFFLAQEVKLSFLSPMVVGTGAVALPLAAMLLFFETNVVRNISLYQVFKMVLLGVAASLLVSVPMHAFMHASELFSWILLAAAGVLQEVLKIGLLVSILWMARYKWTLNGMLLGAAVGAGFAMGETFGFAYIGGSENGSGVLDTVNNHGALAVLGYQVMWSALVGGALWKACGDDPLSLDLVYDPAVIRAAIFVAILHVVWLLPINIPLHGRYLILGAITWVAVLSYLSNGLQQVREAQEELGIAPKSDEEAASD